MTDIGAPALTSSPAVSSPVSIRPSGTRPAGGAGLIQDAARSPLPDREDGSLDTRPAVFGRETDVTAADPPDIELSMASFRLHFRHDQESGRVAVTVIDAETREIIREIPPEELLRISKKLHETMGILFDRKM